MLLLESFLILAVLSFIVLSLANTALVYMKIEMAKKSNIKFRFVDETPLDPKKENPLLFGHKEIVMTLEKIVDNSPQSFTVGLFGDWGSGKSTIVENLKDRLENRNNALPVVVFDVWKHEGDALRRTFLRHIDRELQPKFQINKQPIEDRINKEITTSKTESTFSTRPFIWSLILTYGFFFAIAVCGYFLIQRLFEIEDFKLDDLGDYAVLILAIFPLTTFVERILNKNKQEVTINEKADILQDPIDFEDIFKKILLNLKVSKMVVVFDNLDRVSGKKAVEIISTIKTFLESADKNVDKQKKRDVTFIIPCDVKAIKNHLKNVFNSEVESAEIKNYSNEYLRKFFNTVIRIPDFYEIELEEFARDKLAETQIEGFVNPELASLITRAFSQNPRQIIQFINTLISSYLLIKERQDNDLGIDTDFIEDRIPQLAKFILLQRKFPEEMEILRQKRMYDLNNLDRAAFFSQDIQEFEDYLRYTAKVNISPSESLVFFKLRRTEQERSFPEIERLFRIDFSRLAKLKHSNGEVKHQIQKDIEFINDFGIESNVRVFSDVIKQRLKLINNPVDKLILLNDILNLLEFKKLQLSASAYYEIEDSIEVWKEYLHHMDVNVLAIGIIDNENIRPHIKKLIFDQWYGIVNDYANVDPMQYRVDEAYLIDIFIQYRERSSRYIEKIHEVNLSKILGSSFSSNDLVAKIFGKNEADSKRFVNSDFVSGYLQTLKYSDFKEDPEKVTLINDYSSKLYDERVVLTFIDKLVELTQYENEHYSDTTTEEAEILFEFGKIGLQKVDIDLPGKEEILNRLDKLSDALVGSEKSIEWTENWYRIPTIYELAGVLDDNHGEQLLDSILEFIEEVRVESFEKFVNLLGDKSRDFIQDESFWDKIKEKTFDDLDNYFHIVFESVDTINKRELLVDLFDDQLYDRFLDELDEKFESIDSNDFINTIFEKFREESEYKPDHFKKFLNILNDKAQEIDEINEYVNDLSSLLGSENEENRLLSISEIERSKFISETEKKEIFERLVDQLFEEPSNNLSIIKSLGTSELFIKFFNSDFYATYRANLLDSLLQNSNQSEQGLLEFLSVSLNETEYSDLLSEIFSHIVSQVTKSEPQPMIEFQKLLIASLQTMRKNIFLSKRDSIYAVITQLFVPARHEQLHLLGCDFLIAISSFTNTLRKSAYQPYVDEVFFSSSNLNLRINLEGFLSDSAKNQSLRINTAILKLGDREIDITQKISDLVKGGLLSITLNYNLLQSIDEPGANIEFLSVDYSLQGNSNTEIIRENQNLTIG